MEDQQSCPGDLTGKSPDEVEDSVPDAAVETTTEPSPDNSDQSNEAATESAEMDNDDAAAVDHAEGDDTGTSDRVTAEDSAEAGDATGPAERRAGWRLAVAAGVSAALFVGAAAFAGSAVQPYLAGRALVATKLEIVRTAVKAITTLWNYTPENMDTLADRASIYLSGDLEVDYRKFIDAIAPANKQAQVTDTTEITGAAVESLNGPEATVIVYTNTSATSELTKAVPSLKYLSYRLFMKRHDNRWVITKMPTVTSLNLTPQF